MMKRCQLALLLVLAAAAAPAQTAAPAAEDPNHAELRALRDRVLDAINKQDIDTALRDVHPNAIFAAMDGSISRGTGEIRAYFDRMMKGPKPIVKSFKTELSVDELTLLYGGDAGICHGTAADKFELSSGLEFEVMDRWTCALVKENGKWMIASFHASASVFDNPLLGAAKRTLVWSLALGLPLAAAAGFAVGRRSKRAPASPPGGQA